MKTPKERTDMFEKISGYVIEDFVFVLVFPFWRSVTFLFRVHA